jgi:hypothetical protein
VTIFNLQTATLRLADTNAIRVLSTAMTLR